MDATMTKNKEDGATSRDPFDNDTPHLFTPMPLPHDHIDRVYAGVLGKLIGVYLGRPFEQWSHERIARELGEITYYVSERRGHPLIVTDDDISGTFTFFRAFADYGRRSDLSPAQIGQTWLNYILEKKTILWWGGVGTSTEHTAYHRLASGVSAPRSGAIVSNGRVLAEQIGGQIFIDAWGLLHPGDPAAAADFARRAASVSHDGEGVHGAQVVAALIAAAFVERDVDRLIDIAVAQIPRDSLVRLVIDDVRGWHADAPADWRYALRCIHEQYPYERFGGVCPMVSNHALIHLALLYSGGEFNPAMTVVTTAGWDTDCNAGNVGCILGVRNGLAALSAGPDWRGPVADRLLLPTAEGGAAITDAVRETYTIANGTRCLRGLEPLAPKADARFHFSLPGSVQGFLEDPGPDSRGTARIANVETPGDGRALAVTFSAIGSGRPARVLTSTFTPAEPVDIGWYPMCASPTLYSGSS